VVAGALDRLLPPARYRQWVLVIPKRLRYFMNSRPELAGYLSKLLARKIDRYLKQKSAGIPAQVLAIRRKLLRRLCRLGCLPQEAAEDMLRWKNSGFSLHKEVLIYPHNRQGLERLLGYCSQPGLSLKRLIYASKSKIAMCRAERHDCRPEMMTPDPVEFLRRWGLLRPPHKNPVHYYGALAPRSPLRSPLRPALTA
jgi:hypothetical protein